jgi:hypothetical protein
LTEVAYGGELFITKTVNVPGNPSCHLYECLGCGRYLPGYAMLDCPDHPDAPNYGENLAAPGSGPAPTGAGESCSVGRNFA